MLRLFVVALFLAPAVASADCYSWPLRTDAPAYDGDTIRITMPGLPPEISSMSVRVAGIDAPEIKGKCDSEKAKAIEARDFMTAKLAGAASVKFCNVQWDKYGGRILATVHIDGENLADLLIQRGLARPYDGGKRGGWCP